ncbi:MAG: ArsR family transcriptional regulator, lead/cadmium/zinc/bismuth-responsive transcriptional [Eubacteriales bacterium]|nr:ArsR family transcriptional regulator, lead/cadmium/zinc/bismuth-responsive transcriptional [Eubacteriales bacterium]
MRNRAEKDVCEIECIHSNRVAQVRAAKLSEEEVENLAALFKAMGDPTRLQIIDVLSHGELCVCDIAALLGKTVSAVSHQLRYLRTMKLVRYRREGKIVYYSLDDDHIFALYRQGLEHVRENK